MKSVNHWIKSFEKMVDYDTDQTRCVEAPLCPFVNKSQENCLLKSKL